MKDLVTQEYPTAQEVKREETPHSQTAVAVRQEEEEFSVEQVKAQVQKIALIMKETMKKDEHYGQIPGTKSKPVLLKAGAEKLAFTFRLAPDFDVIERDLPRDHRDYRVQCRLTHIPTQRVLGEGVGSCSTMEGKYRFRKEGRTCPVCEATAIIKGKAEYGGGWLCFAKKGGCGEKWDDQSSEAQVFEKQQLGRVEHDNPADYYNTALKMAKKRAQVDATLTVTAASDFFTQDLEPLPPTLPPTTLKELEPQPKAKVTKPHIEAEVVEYATSDQIDHMKELMGMDGLSPPVVDLLSKAVETGATKAGAQRLIDGSEKIVKEFEATQAKLTENDMPL